MINGRKQTVYGGNIGKRDSLRFLLGLSFFLYFLIKNYLFLVFIYYFYDNVGNKKKGETIMSKYHNSSSMYDQDQNNKIADQLEAYLDAVDNLIIIEGKDVDEIKKAKKKVKKAIKNLREGKPEKVFDEERFDEYEERGMII